MTDAITASNQVPVSETDDLPSPGEDSFSPSSGPGARITLPRPIPSISDTGRIKFGAACRIPVQK